MKAKKLLAVLLAVLTAASLLTLTPAAGAANVSQQTAQQVVSALGIIVGDSSGNMNLDGTLTRSQMAKVLVKLSGSAALSSATSPFPDVPYTNWAAPYVGSAVSLGYLNGMPDGTFKPDQTATTEELAKTLLAVLGYTSTDYGVGYPGPQVAFARKLGLFDGVTAQVGAAITRRDVITMVYNTLAATAKSGKTYVTALGYSTTAAGDIDVSAILNANSVGPITVKNASWYSGTGLNTSTAAVYLNDKTSMFSAIQTNDIVYYSVNLNTVWAYDKKVTGTLQSAQPSRLSPTSVVISGTTYTLDSAAASEAAGYLGTFSYGDTVTLLLDRDGGVADIIPADASATVTGFVAAAGSKQYQNNDDGSTYTAYYVDLVAPDGSKSEYQLAFDASSYIGTVVTVGFTGGTPKLTASPAAAVSGTVSYADMTIGTQKMSSGIQIMDVDSYGNYADVYPQRLDGIVLSSLNVLSAQTDATGTITQLILNGVTGDTSSYGVLTEVNPSSPIDPMNISVTYTYNIAGTIGTIKTTNINFGVSEGPAAFTYKNGTIAMIKPLASLGNVTLSGGNAVVTSAGAYYLLSDKAVIHQQDSDGGYKVISAAAASGMTLTAYADKSESTGGRVRVLIAQ